MSTETTTIRTIAKTEDEFTPIIIDFGKHSRKKIKRVVKGKDGKLMDKVREAVAQLREEGVMGATAQPVVIVIRQRCRSRGLPALFR